MTKKIFSILFAVFMLSCIASSGQTKPQSVSEVITEVTVDDYEPHVFTSSKGDTIQYRLFVPSDYDADKTYPLVYWILNRDRGRINPALQTS